MEICKKRSFWRYSGIKRLRDILKSKSWFERKMETVWVCAHFLSCLRAFVYVCLSVALSLAEPYAICVHLQMTHDVVLLRKIYNFIVALLFLCTWACNLIHRMTVSLVLSFFWLAICKTNRLWNKNTAFTGP